ncbi:MAG: hypothetical protein ACI8P9_002206 [Parasphingorhabdus sp.]
MIPDPYTGENESSDTLFRDVLSLALLGFIAIIVLLLPHINPKGVENASNAPISGNLIVEITWPNEQQVDVDLWVQAPNDVIVGFSNKGGAIFNLLRDDLGRMMDLSSINHEIAYTRGVVAGEYTVNAHLYRSNWRTPPPVKVETTISIKKAKPDGTPFVAPILFTTAKLEHEGQEITLVRFKLTEEGRLVKNSVHSLYRELRTRKAK